MAVFLCGITLWIWLPLLRYTLFFAGVHERVAHDMRWTDAMNLALPVALSLAWFLSALRGEGTFRAKIIRKFDNSWLNGRAAERCAPTDNSSRPLVRR